MALDLGGAVEHPERLKIAGAPSVSVRSAEHIGPRISALPAERCRGTITALSLDRIASNCLRAYATSNFAACLAFEGLTWIAWMFASGLSTNPRRLDSLHSRAAPSPNRSARSETCEADNGPVWS